MNSKKLSRSSWFYKFLCISDKNETTLMYEASDVTTCSLKWMAVRSVLTLCGMLGMLAAVCGVGFVLLMCAGSLIAFIAAWVSGLVPTLELFEVAIRGNFFLMPGLFFGLISSIVGIIEGAKAFANWRKRVKYQRERELIMKGLPEPTPGVVGSMWNDFVNKVCHKVELVD